MTTNEKMVCSSTLTGLSQSISLYPYDLKLFIVDGNNKKKNYIC